MDNQIQTLRQMIDQSRYTVFFGGAGVSTESGIPDFRSPDGLYHLHYQYPPETIISHSFFMQNPAEFYRFYRDKMLWPQAEPNPAHRKLAELEAAGRLQAVITQNIDGLHQAAGSREVLELHGSVRRNYCMKCGKRFSMEDVLQSQGEFRCDCGGLVKPDVVLYEEALAGFSAGQADSHQPSQNRPRRPGRSVHPGRRGPDAGQNSSKNPLTGAYSSGRIASH